jgi:hypothetical protein
LVESTNPDHLLKTNEVINACLPHANKSVRIGTGVPGVGKAPSLAFGKHLTGLGKSSCSGRRPEQYDIHTEVFWVIKPEWRS